MKLHTLKPAKGSVRDNKRKGRGQGSTLGNTSGRGHKGDKARSGSKEKKGFEGGQMPLQRRTPKRGFNSLFRTEYVGINLDKVQELVDKYQLREFSFDKLRELKLVKQSDKVKILGRGELKAKGVQFNVHAYSEAAKTAIENSGGAANLL
ncbi:MAG: 50S ribosomal protein L15 [Sphingobacteriales bacterium]|nr:50S ribosomal protein L15 [Sphingobacteriales bacterium]